MKDHTRTKIMEAASQLFTEKGYSGTTTLAIAAQSGVNESTIFRNFGSKKNLYMEIFCANTPGAEDILLSGLTNGADLKKDLSLMFREYINTCVRHIPNYRLSVQQVDEIQDQEFYLQSAERFENMKTQMTAYLNLLQSFGRIAETDCSALSEYLFSLFMIQAPSLAGPGTDPCAQAQEDLIQECTDFFFQLLSVPSPASSEEQRRQTI